MTRYELLACLFVTCVGSVFVGWHIAQYERRRKPSEPVDLAVLITGYIVSCLMGFLLGMWLSTPR